MPSTKHEIIDDINNHIQRHGGKYSDWCVGVTTILNEWLYLRKAEQNNLILKRACTAYVAAQVQEYFVKTFGVSCGIVIDDDSANVVYAYKNLAMGSCGRPSVQ